MNAIEIKGLEKHYKGFSLGPVDLILPSGCIMGLIGENGAGKSTIIKLILNIAYKDKGTINILGKDNTQRFELTKEDIGVVLDEVGYPHNITADHLNNVMKYSFKNWDEKLYYEYVEKLEIPLKKEFQKMSRGMKMKTGIACAMAHKPKLLILDEATSGLDPVVRDEVVDMFNEFTRDENHAVLISSHIVSDLEKLCDYIAFLHKGKLILMDEKDAIKEKYGVIHCTAGELEELDNDAVLGKRISSYGAEAIIKRDMARPGMEVGPVSIEDLFVFMVKGEQ